MNLTEKQAQVFDMIRAYIAEHGYPPTRPEIAKHFGFTPNAARDYVLALQKKGALRVTPNVARGLTVL